MKNKVSQKDRIINELNKNGRISRNWCLNNFPRITRLAVYIDILKKEGWDLHKSEVNNDCIYTIAKSPLHKVVYKLPDGREIVTYQK